MLNKAIKMEVEPEIIIQASTSPEYIKSIKESRDDYKAGRVKSHEEVFKYSEKLLSSIL
jgi:hypothetical protein